MPKWLFPGWRATALAAVLALQLAALGVWQLSRASTDSEFAEALSERPDMAAASSDEVAGAGSGLADDGELPQYAFRSISLTGRYIPDEYFLIRNRFFKGRAGYWIIHPFEELRFLIHYW